MNTPISVGKKTKCVYEYTCVQSPLCMEASQSLSKHPLYRDFAKLPLKGFAKHPHISRKKDQKVCMHVCMELLGVLQSPLYGDFLNHHLYRGFCMSL